MPTRILIVRTSSLGDLVHMLPAMSDIARHVLDAHIDWVAEESFAEIPSWHPAVKDVIKVAHRRWRKSWWSPQVRAERKLLRERFRDTRYDVVLDMQALLKSAWLVHQSHGVKHGLDWKSAREPLASLFYDVRHRVQFWQPAVIRQRSLAGLTFGYTPSGTPDFGLQHFARETRNGDAALGGDYAVIMPSASRDDKLWPEADWHAVFTRLREAGCQLKLLAGNDREAARARELIVGFDNAEVAPRMDLKSVARLLAGSRMMVGLDSGLTHLSAALGRPTIGIYRASTPIRTPLVGDSYTASLGDRGAPPSREVVLAALEQALAV
ncbi:lipopolysaccharide heptosyltransferase I [Bordetella sp. LUAb4]|uniref:lipopolysaccharide heptosyltransferase I n=1 Tax=Bordetella sp. LUAb4 TaxID=2843195 RepID=UPI001E357F69|nr:lipopolysaccharide heptosyltransferase I [Bordetella sp. LUAb4]